LALTVQQAGVGANDRLSFTVFIAIALHALVVLTDFLEEDPREVPFTMEITLSQFDDEKKPEKADFLAETNQQGSGTLDKKARVTSPVQANQQHLLEQHASSPAPQSKVTEKNPKPVVSSINSERLRPSLFDRVIEAAKPDQVQPRRSILERSLEIAELEADLDKQRQNYAKRPRVTRLTAASTMKAVDSQYVAHVVSKIEKTGNLNFPEEAGKKLYGKPRVSISIYSDGSIKDVSVLQSSGNLVLDSETVNIVHRAAPFAPFPKNVRKERDVLELIRTFSYNQRGVSSY
jgi:protein TonB